MSTVWLSSCRKRYTSALGTPGVQESPLKTEPGPQATFLGVVTPANRTSDRGEADDGRWPRGGPGAAGQASGTAACVLREGLQTRPTPKAAGSPETVPTSWQPPFVCVVGTPSFKVPAC